MKKFAPLIFLMILAAAIWIATYDSSEEFQGVRYTIIKQSRLGNIKANLEVRLEKKVSKEFLYELSRELREKYSQYDKLFIKYYLPGTASKHGAWATAYFTPDLEVRILGVLAIEEDYVNQVQGKIIGAWLNDRTGEIYVIVRRGTKYYMVFIDEEGEQFEQKIKLQVTPKHKKYIIEESEDGNHYMIDKYDGSLAAFNGAGFIGSMKRIYVDGLDGGDDLTHEVLGVWSDKQLGAIYVLFRLDNDFFLSCNFTDGGQFLEAVVLEKISNKPIEQFKKKDSYLGEYFKIDKYGFLNFYDNSTGYIKSIPPLDNYVVNFH